MTTELAVALLSLLGTLGIVTCARLTRYRIGQLEQKVDKHNGLVERMTIVEQSCKSAHHRLDELREGMEHEG